jgi:8-oxo-dGTP diphosphatase
MDKIARIGIGVFVFKNGKFLMGRRRNAHGDGTWSIPGGHLEFGETFEDTAKREVLEETGLAIKNVRFGAVTNDYFRDEGKHYVTVWVLSDWESGKEHITEPDKYVDMEWRDFDTLPEPLFLPWQQLLSSQFIDSMKDELTKSR